jgi:hypothetical protein
MKTLVSRFYRFCYKYRIGHFASTKKPPSRLRKGSKNNYINLWEKASLGRGVKTDGSVIERR